MPLQSGLVIPPASILFLQSSATIHWAYTSANNLLPPWPSGAAYALSLVLLFYHILSSSSRFKTRLKSALLLQIVSAVISLILITTITKETDNLADLEIHDGLLIKIDHCTPGRHYSRFTGTIIDGHQGMGEKIILTRSGNQCLTQGSTIYYAGKISKTRSTAAEDDRFSVSLNRKGFSYQAFIDDASMAIVAKNEPSHLEAIRTSVSTSLENTLSPDASGLLSALFLAKKDGLSVRISTLFRKAGLSHLLAASGMHVGMITFLPLLMSRFWGRFSPLTLFLSFVPLGTYLLITGMPVSLARAGIMFFIYTLSKMVTRETRSLQILFLTGTLLLLILPWELYGAGFQLSFSATLTILLFTRQISRGLGFIPSWMKTPLAVSCAAQIGVIPIAAYHFHEIALGGILTTIIAAPVTALLMATGFLLLLSTYLSVFTPQIAWSVETITSVFLAIAEKTASLNLIINTNSSSLITPAVIAFLVILLISLPRKAIAVTAALITSIMVFMVSNHDYRLRASAFQNNSMEITEENNTLIIAGPVAGKKRFDQLKQRIFLHTPHNVILTITEDDFKNLTAYTKIIRSLPITGCHIAIPLSTEPAFLRLMDTLQREKINVTIK